MVLHLRRCGNTITKHRSRGGMCRMRMNTMRLTIRQRLLILPKHHRIRHHAEITGDVVRRSMTRRPGLLFRPVMLHPFIARVERRRRLYLRILPDQALPIVAHPLRLKQTLQYNPDPVVRILILIRPRRLKIRTEKEVTEIAELRKAETRNN